jgi:hypothetical protein
MAKSIVDFLVELDTNSKLMESYKRDPVTTASDYGLSNEELTLIKEKNWDEVTRRFDDTEKAIRVVNY